MKAACLPIIALILLAGCSGSPSGGGGSTASASSLSVTDAAVHGRDFCFKAADGNRYDAGLANGCFVLTVSAYCGEVACSRFTGMTYYTMADAQRPPVKTWGNPNSIDGDCARGQTCHLTLYFAGGQPALCSTCDAIPPPDWTAFKVLYDQSPTQGGSPLSAAIPPTERPEARREA